MNQNTLSQQQQQQQQQYAAAAAAAGANEGHSSPAVLGTSQQPQVVPLYELSPGSDTTKNTNNIDNNESGLLHYHPRQRGAGFAPSSRIVVVSNKPSVGAATTTTTTRVRDLKSDKIVDAWDKIGTLTSEMTQSIMKKQADFVAKRYRLGGNGGGGGSSERGKRQEGPYKKRRMELEESSSLSSSSSEEESGSSPVTTTTTTPLVLPEENWSESLSRHVDRMARMSKLIMEIEYCHRLLRKEMVEIQNDLCSC